MAGEREFHAPAERHALHRGDARLAHRLDLAEGELSIVGQYHRFVERMDFLEHLADVRARHKGCRALPGEHHRDDIVFPRQLIDHDDQLVDRAFVERVDGRVGDGDGRDALPRRDGVVLHEEIAIALEQ